MRDEHLKQQIDYKLIDYTVLENLTLPILLCDISGVLFYANQAALVMLSQSMSYVSGRQLEAVIGRYISADGATQLRSVIAAGKLHGNLDTDQAGTWQINKNQHGAPYYLCVFQPEMKPTDSQPIEQMRHVVSILAHEIKNPLAGMRGAAQILSGKVSQDMQHFTKLLMDEVDRIGDLVESLSFFEEQPKGREKWLNMHAVIHQAKEVLTLGQGCKINIIEEFDPSLPDIFMDEHGLTQVMTNVLKNAIEASEDDGDVLIKTAYKHDTYTHGQKTPLIISVYNLQNHIDDEIRAHLFTPFMTSKNKGKGLGLSISRQIMNRYGGDITLENQGEDVLCQILLPLLKEPMHDHEPS